MSFSDIPNRQNGQTIDVSWFNSIKSQGQALETEVAGIAGSAPQTLTNKTIVVANNTVTTAASGNLTATELNAALAELQLDIDNRATSAQYASVAGNLNVHMLDTATAHGATSTNSASKIVMRDSSGNFSAGTITANLSGNASTASSATTATTAGTATNFSGSLSGDVTGTQGATTVGKIKGVTVDDAGKADGKALVYKAASGNLEYSNTSGTGDVSSNTSTSVDSEVALFSGTGGKTIMRASVTGTAYLTNGVLSTQPAPSVSVVTISSHSGGFSANGTGTYTTPANVKWIRVRMVGGGGGGGGGGSAGNLAGTGGNGGSTTFGSSLLVANGGTGGACNQTFGGAGGTASIGAGAVGVAITGAQGNSPANPSATTNYTASGAGGASFFGGPGGSTAAGVAASAPVANTGSGGGGGSFNGTGYQGAGGGAGGFIDAIITPSAGQTFAYSVGAGGTAGAGATGTAGAAGAGGIIIVEQFY